MTRIYTEVELTLGNTVSLESDICHHLKNVIKAPLKSQVQLFNNTGQVCNGEIVELSRTKAEIKITQIVEVETESSLSITLVQSVSRGDRMDYTLQKCIEMGITHIIPVISSRTVVRLNEKKKISRLKHWAGVIKHATEQSGRTHIASLAKISAFENWIAEPTQGDIIILDPSAKMSLPKYLLKTKSVTVIAGPEGGFTIEELALLKRRKTSTTVALGPRILRSETAAVCAISILQALWGDLA